MKNKASFSVLCGMLVLLLGSCQKSYDRPDITLGTGTGSGSSQSGSSSGTLLVKSESKTRGSTEASTIIYTYNASSHLLSVTSVDVDSFNNSTTTFYHYSRDASERITKIATNVLSVQSPNSGLPDSIVITVHYPTASSVNFDYSTYTINSGGISFKDSIAYVYSNGILTDEYEYSGSITGTMQLLQRLQYTFTNNNLVTEYIYDGTVSATKYLGTYAIEYDTKTAGLYTGNEGFLPGQNAAYACKNNLTKFTFTDNTTNTVIVNSTYAYQYNANNQPVSGTIQSTIPVNKTADVKNTYQ